MPSEQLELNTDQGTPEGNEGGPIDDSDVYQIPEESPEVAAAMNDPKFDTYDSVLGTRVARERSGIPTDEEPAVSTSSEAEANEAVVDIDLAPEQLGIEGLDKAMRDATPTRKELLRELLFEGFKASHKLSGSEWDSMNAKEREKAMADMSDILDKLTELRDQQEYE